MTTVASSRVPVAHAGPAATNAPDPSKTQSIRHYNGPDLLRLLAASLVVLYHLSETGGARPSWPVVPSQAPLGWLHSIAWMGWIGVPIFFVLSGFLISASAVNSTPTRFLRKLAIRIIPVLWISCLIAFMARMLWGEPIAELLPSLLRTAVLWPKGPYLDGVVWTLVVEAAFYALVAFGLQCSRQEGRVRHNLVWLALAIGIASTVFTVARRIAAGIDGGAPALSAMGSFVFDVLLLRQGMFFAIGMLLFHLIDHRLTRPILAALAIFAICACLQIVDSTADTGNPLVPVLIWGVATALIFASVKHSSRLPWLQRLKVSRELGLMTYPLYLNHFVLSQALMPLLALWLPGGLVFPVLFGGLLANAWLIARFPERWLQTWFGSLRFAVPATTICKPSLRAKSDQVGNSSL